MLSRVVIYFRVLGELLIEKYHKPNFKKAPSKNQLKPPKQPRKQHPKKQKPFTLYPTHKTTRRNGG